MKTELIQKTEGIILQVIPYQNYDEIITLFTLEYGLLKFFCKKRKGQAGRYSPLSRVEVAFRERNSELFACEDISLVQANLNLRNQLDHLQAACEMIRAISFSQHVGVPAPLLYNLLLFYLDKIPQVKDVWILAGSLKLKILKHDGLLNEEFIRTNPILMLLAHGRNYSEIAALELSPELKKQIDDLFDCGID